MVNISSLLPPVNTHKLKSSKRRDVAVAGSEADKHAPKPAVEQNQEKRKGKDRRQRQQKPLVEMRSGRDRRHNPKKPSINIKV